MRLYRPTDGRFRYGLLMILWQLRTAGIRCIHMQSTNCKVMADNVEAVYLLRGDILLFKKRRRRVHQAAF